jgi:hypothetical protein
MAMKSSALHADRALPQKVLLVFISLRCCVNPSAIVRLDGLGSLETCNDLIHNGTRNLTDSV